MERGSVTQTNMGSEEFRLVEGVVEVAEGHVSLGEVILAPPDVEELRMSSKLLMETVGIVADTVAVEVSGGVHLHDMLSVSWGNVDDSRTGAFRRRRPPCRWRSVGLAMTRTKFRRPPRRFSPSPIGATETPHRQSSWPQRKDPFQ